MRQSFLNFLDRFEGFAGAEGENVIIFGWKRHSGSAKNRVLMLNRLTDGAVPGE